MTNGVEAMESNRQHMLAAVRHIENTAQATDAGPSSTTCDLHAPMQHSVSALQVGVSALLRNEVAKSTIRMQQLKEARVFGWGVAGKVLAWLVVAALTGLYIGGKL